LMYGGIEQYPHIILSSRLSPSSEPSIAPSEYGFEPTDMPSRFPMSAVPVDSFAAASATPTVQIDVAYLNERIRQILDPNVPVGEKAALEAESVLGAKGSPLADLVGEYLGNKKSLPAEVPQEPEKSREETLRDWEKEWEEEAKLIEAKELSLELQAEHHEEQISGIIDAVNNVIRSEGVEQKAYDGEDCRGDLKALLRPEACDERVIEVVRDRFLNDGYLGNERHRAHCAAIFDQVLNEMGIFPASLSPDHESPAAATSLRDDGDDLPPLVNLVESTSKDGQDQSRS
jgi:hypothetical protein